MVPGMMMFWPGTIATIPSGWHLCDGTMGTPDMRNRFAICAWTDDAGESKATINGVLAKSGGTQFHQHTHDAGADLADGAPLGSWSIAESVEYHTPQCVALCFIMKL